MSHRRQRGVAARRTARDGGHGPSGQWPSLPAATAIAFGLALLVHGVVAWQYVANPFRVGLVADALSYHEWALRLLTRGLEAEPVFHQAPLFPLLLSGWYRLLGPSPNGSAALPLICLSNAMALALLIPLGRLGLGSVSAGVWAFTLGLLHGPFIFYGMKLLPGPLGLLTGVLALLVLLAARERPSHLLAAVAGLAWGLAALARAEILLFVPLAAVFLIAGARGRPPTLLPRLVSFALGVGLALLPATAHNVGRGSFVLVASSGGENLFIGNQRGGNGGHTPLHPRAGDLFSQRALAERLAAESLRKEVSAAEVSAYWRARAIDEVRTAPLAWLGVMARKLGRLSHPGDPTDLYSFALERERYLSLLHALPVGAWTILFLGAVGLVLAWRTPYSRAGPLIGWVALQLAVLLVFFVDTRLRLGLLFALLPFAGLCAARAVEAWRAGRRLLPAVAALLALSGVTAGVISTRATPRDRVRLASVLSMQDRLDEALDSLDVELASSNPDGLALDTAGWIRQKQGRLEQAQSLYRRALAAGLPAARVSQVRSRLARTLELSGDAASAATEHDLAVASPEANAGAWYERGAFRLRRGDPLGAERDWLEAARLDPGWEEPRRALRELGRRPLMPAEGTATAPRIPARE